MFDSDSISAEVPFWPNIGYRQTAYREDIGLCVVEFVGRIQERMRLIRKLSD